MSRIDYEVIVVFVKLKERIVFSFQHIQSLVYQQYNVFVTFFSTMACSPDVIQLEQKTN